MFVNEDYSVRVIKKRTELMPKLNEARRKNPVNSGSTNDERA